MRVYVCVCVSSCFVFLFIYTIIEFFAVVSTTSVNNFFTENEMREMRDISLDLEWTLDPFPKIRLIYTNVSPHRD